MKSPSTGTVGHAIATSILSKKEVPMPPDQPSKSQAGPIHLPGLHNIDVRPASNGIVIKHTPHSKGKQGDADYGKEQTNVFTNAADAHAHLGKLLDCPNCKGSA